MIIRKATEADARAIHLVESTCFPPLEAADEQCIKERILKFNDYFWVAEQDSKIVGTINGCCTNHDKIYDDLYEDVNLHNPNGKYYAIFSLAVLPEYQKQGIASKLMDKAINISRENNKQGLVLACKDKLIDMYKHLGYSHLGESKSKHGGATWHDMLYIL